MPRSYKDLKAWRRAFRFCARVYQLTQGFPAAEQAGLTTELRRNALAVPAHIAHGYVQDNPAEYSRFLRTARGVLAELETRLMLSWDLELARPEDIEPVLEEADGIDGELVTLLQHQAKRADAREL